MPYIPQSARPMFKDMLEYTPDAMSSGGLNYAITQVVHKFIQRNGESYETFNKAIGVLDCAKMELYRRHVAKYEDGKIKENGDVP